MVDKQRGSLKNWVAKQNQQELFKFKQKINMEEERNKELDITLNLTYWA